MKAAGIICEFNPFHNGHKYLLERVRQELQPDALVCVMSGNFVQRGEPAMWNKYSRAKAAVLCGADLVIELPVYAAVNSASEFAKGGISILKGLGIVDTIAFGSEIGDAKILKRAAEMSVAENKAFSAVFRDAIDKGISYAKAYEIAVTEQIKDLPEHFFEGSNNILALEYIKQNILTSANLNIFTVKRIGSAHDSFSPEECLASASYLRNTWFTDNKNYVNFIPSECLDLFEDSQVFDFKANEALFQMLRLSILNTSLEEIAALSEASEGLENLVKKAVLNASNTDELIQYIKSKRYTYARISRLLIQLLLNLNKYSVKEAFDHPYARVLAFNETGREAIKCSKEKASIPVITNLNKQVKQNDPILAGLNLDFHASDVYNVITSNNIYENSDKVCNCIPVNI